MKCNFRIKNLSIFGIPDNREVIMTAGEIRRVVQEEIKAREDEMFERAKKDITAQLMATILTELHNEFGFGKKRLKRVKRGTEALFRAMLQNGIMGKKFDTLTCVAYLKKKFDIDVDKEEA